MHTTRTSNRSSNPNFKPIPMSSKSARRRLESFLPIFGIKELMCQCRKEECLIGLLQANIICHMNLGDRIKEMLTAKHIEVLSMKKEGFSSRERFTKLNKHVPSVLKLTKFR